MTGKQPLLEEKMQCDSPPFGRRTAWALAVGLIGRSLGLVACGGDDGGSGSASSGGGKYS